MDPSTEWYQLTYLHAPAPNVLPSTCQPLPHDPTQHQRSLTSTFFPTFHSPATSSTSYTFPPRNHISSPSPKRFLSQNVTSPDRFNILDRHQKSINLHCKATAVHSCNTPTVAQHEGYFQGASEAEGAKLHLCGMLLLSILPSPDAIAQTSWHI